MMNQKNSNIVFVFGVLLSSCGRSSQKNSQGPAPEPQQVLATPAPTPLSQPHNPEVQTPQHQDSKPTSPSQPDSAVAPVVVSDPFDYQFEIPKTASKESCSTGLVKNNSLRSMCLALQDEELNHGCAFDARVEKFIQACPDFQWLESSKCTVALLKPDASLSFSFDPPEAQFIVAQKSYCVGRSELVDIPSLNIKFDEMLPGIGMKVEGSFEIKPLFYGSRMISEHNWKIQFVKPDGSLHTDIEGFVDHNSLNSISSGTFSDSSFKYRIQCVVVPKCASL